LQQVSCSPAPAPSTSGCRWRSRWVSNFFWRDSPDPAATHGRPAVSTDRSGDHEASPAVVHVLGIDGWMVIIRRIQTHGGPEGLDSPWWR